MVDLLPYWNLKERPFEATWDSRFFGVPREVNRIAKLALEHAWVQASHNISVASVDAVVRDLERHEKIA